MHRGFAAIGQIKAFVIRVRDEKGGVLPVQA
ncbi:hypothetical protein F783_017660 [Bordetella holmesii F627]|nr:hypothetical protein F783_017660 [Bordetella holmesii F627]